MVERLKIAIAKARERRGAEAPAKPKQAALQPSPSAFDRVWSGLAELHIDPEILERERIVTRQKSDAAHIAFDMLRTRLAKLALEQGWKRIGITSPSKGCGKTVISANLAFSFARHPENRTLLADLDLRSPRLSSCLGITDRRSIHWLLNGSTPPEQYLQRIGDRFALALNTQRVRDASEVIQHANTGKVLSGMIDMLQPDIVIYDLPPLLVGDDAIAFMPNLDAVLLVIASGETKPYEVEECESLIVGETNFLGVLLNKVERGAGSDYYYGYGYGYGKE
ncbi:CpsD/CapB family tyrosine-protein kinase [Paralimibaculum aggregatum]|uniref:CpsD/CapB family tyrosine-protein kinase n=1 Tax=Paralimibaculum aggregatum TaxID=3036245 RepID=A0ABQ6LLE9_9RHOB|nr:CpsD/CapB family tyrosine-protein kinase [Limibaculum sp. NKW23]GMG83261.1 CpsD/CapB family tyrosine-protein kinase [Limibaculum sp. NKW23]